LGWVLRRPTDRTNPTLPGGVYGFYITKGIGVFWYFDGARVRFVLFISDGGRYGMDSIIELSYKGVTIPTTDFKFHPGTYTKQISPVQITSVDASGNTFTKAGHPFNNNDLIRLRSQGGTLPGGTSAEIKVYVVNKTSTTFQVSLTSGGAAIDLTNSGSGTIYAWLANAGWDDPDQGLPTYCPQVNTTFSGICYAEGKLPSTYNTNEEPDWDEFRVIGHGRKVMNYDASGAELGLVSGGNALLRNPALCAVDSLVVDYSKPLSRIDFPSMVSLKNASNVLVWERVDTSQSGKGLKAKYCIYTTTPVYTDPILTRRDSQINFDFGSASPAPGLPATNYCIEWDGQIKFKYSENYTITAEHDDGAIVVINGSTVINQSSNGTHTGTFNATAGTVYTINVKFNQATGPGKCILKWQSASLPIEVIPMESFFENDEQIPRYEYNGAASAPVEAYEYFERIMRSCPGWDWTDKDGKVRFLSPDRAIIYYFIFDAEDPDVQATFLSGTFEKKLRHRRERRNFGNASYRNRRYTGFPEGFVEQQRPRLRELGNGMPNNDAPDDYMVMFENQAQRVIDSDFKLSSDPTHTILLSSQKPSGVATKSQYVRVRNWVKGDRRIADAICKVDSVTRQGNKLDFEFVPIPYPFYEDEEV
jgi:hypothetical protein